MARSNRIGGDRDPFLDDNEDDAPPSVTPQSAAANAYGLSVNARKPNLSAVDRQRTKFNLVSMGIDIADTITEQELLDQVRVLNTVTDETFWYWGDLMWAGERRGFTSVYTETERITGIPVETLKVYAWLSRSISVILRGIAGVTKSHYKLIAHLSDAEQEQWVNRIVYGNWSVRQLKAGLAGKDIPPTPLPKDKPAKIKSAYAQTAVKLAKFESGVGGFRSRDDARKAIAEMRQWLDDLERTL